MLALAIAPAAPAQDRITLPRERVLPVSMRVERSDVATPPLTGTGLLWRGRVFHPAPVPALRLHLVVKGQGTAWRLIVRSELTGAVVETYESTSSWVKDGQFWTRDVPGSTAVVDLEASGDCSQLSVAIDQYGFDVRPSMQQAIHGIDGRLAIVDASERIQALGRPVVRLRTMVPGLGQGTCTGFLVTDSLLFTNEHCVASPDEARSTLVDFGYDKPDTPFQTLRVGELVAVNAGLDYALLRLEQPAPPRWGRVTLNPSVAFVEGQPLILPEHPMGGYKQVSIESCEVSGVQMPGTTEEQTDFGHKCDTLNGSSGSPVLDHASAAVIGLHHFGFNPETNTFVNRAVRIALILQDVKTQRPKLENFGQY
jgi:hypothetical protein